MNHLHEQHCKACEGGVQPLNKSEADKLLTKLQDWQLNDGITAISKMFKFKNYYHTMAFVNAVAWIAHQENHHPDLEVSYNSCKITFQTHAIHGLSDNDFICAAKIDQLS